MMALIPAAVVGMSGNKVKTASSTPDSAANGDFKKQAVIKIAESICYDDLCDEALRAALIIAESNFLSGKSSDQSNNNSNEELLKRIEKLYNSNSEIYFTYNENAVYIPCSVCSNGATAKSEKYNYLCSVASPWDCDCQSFNNGNACEGVSMYGVDYLCKKGYSAEDTLKYYLPKLKIMLTNG